MNRRYVPCPFEGCATTGERRNPAWAVHVARVHSRCACGWVGVSWRGHVGQLRRNGSDTTGCRVTARLRIKGVDPVAGDGFAG